MPEDKPRKKTEPVPGLKWKNAIIGTIVILAITAISLWLVWKAAPISPRALIGLLAGLKKGYLALALAFFCGYVVCAGRGYAAAARAIGVRMGFFRSVQVASAELYFSSITPGASGGQPAAAYFMARDGIPVSHSTVILLNNTIHYFSTSMLLCFLAMFLRWRYFLSLSSSFHWVFGIGASLNIVLFGICLALVFAPRLVRAICLPLIRFLVKCRLIREEENVVRRMDALLTEYGRCQKQIRKDPRVQFRVFFWNLLHRLCLYSIAFFVYRSFGFTELGWLDLMVPQSLSAFAVNALPLPGAAGASELVFLQLYENIYPKNDLIPALLLTRGISFYSVLILCGAFTIAFYLLITYGRKSK